MDNGDVKRYHVLFNPLSKAGKLKRVQKKLSASFRKYGMDDSNLTYTDMTAIQSYSDFFGGLTSDDIVIVCGGDGTLNHFINDTEGLTFLSPIHYFACGTGNDFLHDIGIAPGKKPVDISRYIRDLPIASVKGKTYRFLNNVGFGIDGYCTLVGDMQRAKGKKKISYAAIALGGLMGGFHPVHADVTVDGRDYSFDHVWLAPSMNGRYFGGGMMPTPAQDRLNPERTVSILLYYNKSVLQTVLRFPLLFTGKHINLKKMVSVFTGKDIRVRFDRPCALQIDGETIPEVTEYHAYSAS